MFRFVLTANASAMSYFGVHLECTKSCLLPSFRPLMCAKTRYLWNINIYGMMLND